MKIRFSEREKRLLDPNLDVHGRKKSLSYRTFKKCKKLSPDHPFYVSPNNHLFMTDAQLETFERLHPELVQRVDVEKIFYDIEHPMEANLRNAKILSAKFGIPVEVALDLMKLKKLDDIEFNTDIMVHRPYPRHFF